MVARSIEVPRQMVAVSPLSAPGAGSIPISATPKLGASAFLRLTPPDEVIVVPGLVSAVAAGAVFEEIVALSAIGGDTEMISGAPPVALSAIPTALSIEDADAPSLSAVPEITAIASSMEEMVGDGRLASRLPLSWTVARRSTCPVVWLDIWPEVWPDDWPDDWLAEYCCARAVPLTRAALTSKNPEIMGPEIISPANGATPADICRRAMTDRSIGKLFIGDDLVHGNRRSRDFPRRQREKSGANKARQNNQNNTNTIHVRSAIPPAIPVREARRISRPTIRSHSR